MFSFSMALPLEKCQPFAPHMRYNRYSSKHRKSCSRFAAHDSAARPEAAQDVPIGKGRLSVGAGHAVKIRAFVVAAPHLSGDGATRTDGIAERMLWPFGGAGHASLLLPFPA